MDEIMNRIWSDSPTGSSTPESLSDDNQENVETTEEEEDEKEDVIACKKSNIALKGFVPDVDLKIEKAFETPFTWGIDQKLALKFDERQELDTRWDEQPIISLVEAIAMVYIYTTKDQHDKAREKMNNVIDIFTHIDFYEILEKEKVVPIVLNHIIETTRYFFRKYENENRSRLMNELDYIQFIATIPDIKHHWTDKQSQNAARGTLSGCKSIVWSMFHEEELERAIKCANEAIKYNPSSALWHFILGKNLRRRRRHVNFHCQPSVDESKHLLMAYDLSNYDPYFGVFVAQMFRESRHYDKARQMCRNIYEASEKHRSVGIKLRLALSFIKSKDFKLAEECLTFVGSALPMSSLLNNAMYLHYIGIYLCDKERNYKKAIEYFYEAAKLGNAVAELQYTQLMVKIEPNFDCLQQMKNMIKKYAHKKPLVQRITLSIAMYFCKRKDIKSALIYFTKGIIIEPHSYQLKKFRDIIDNSEHNVFSFIRNSVLTKFDKKYLQDNENLLDIYSFLLKMSNINL